LNELLRVSDHATVAASSHPLLLVGGVAFPNIHACRAAAAALPYGGHEGRPSWVMRGGVQEEAMEAHHMAISASHVLASLQISRVPEEMVPPALSHPFLVDASAVPDALELWDAIAVFRSGCVHTALLTLAI